MSIAETALKPRKTPVQARSAATIGALHVAVIQVLTREGLSRCTTTRIAERAGMSVGSLYQYYPNRDALLASVLEKHLDGVAIVVERACRAYRGRHVAEMAGGLVTAFVSEKLRDPRESKALYAIASERGGPELVARIHARMIAAVTALLSSAPDAEFDDPGLTATVALSALAGPVRAMLEGNIPTAHASSLEGQLMRLLGGYLQTYRPADPGGG